MTESILAQPPETNDAFLREVDEELSYDRLMGFLRRFGRMILIVIGLGLAGLAGGLWWQGHQSDIAGQQGEQLSGAIKDISTGKADGVAAKLSSLASNGNEGYRASAKLLSASIAQEKGDLATAIAGFKAVAADTSLDQNWRDAALLRQTAAEYDNLAPDVVIDRLKGLAIPGKPWFGSAGEMVAIAYLKQNKQALAAPLFAQIARDKSVPPSIADRARQMASSLGVDVSADTKDKS